MVNLKNVNNKFRDNNYLHLEFTNDKPKEIIILHFKIQIIKMMRQYLFDISNQMFNQKNIVVSSNY